MTSWEMDAVPRCPIENIVKVAALVEGVEVGEWDFVPLDPVITLYVFLELIVISYGVADDTYEIMPTSALHIRFCLMISMQWSKDIVRV